MVIPACLNDHWTRPEQSNTSGPLPPQTYGLPRSLIATASMTLSCADEAPGSVDGPDPAAPAAEPPVVTTLTSCWTPAPFGSNFATAAAAPLMSMPRTLI